MTLRTYDEIRHLRNEKGKGAKAQPAIASGIVTGDASVSLSKDVFERHTLAGSGLLILDAGFAQFVWTDRLYNSKDTKKHKFGSVKVL